MDIEQKIRQLRTQNSLTLEELASRSELTKGLLSQVERNLTSPSVFTLEDILEALGIDLASFSKDSKENKVVFKKEDYFVDEYEEYYIHWTVPNAQKNEMEPISLGLSSQGSSKEFDPHDGEEFGYVLEGRITLVDGDREYPVKKGETFYINGKYRHYLENNGENEARILWITIPSLFQGGASNGREKADTVPEHRKGL